MIIRAAKRGLRRLFPTAFRARDASALARRRRTLEQILANPAPPNLRGMAEKFSWLQANAPHRTFDYGYDPFSVWSRGVERARNLLSLPGLHASDADILEVACGDGMVGRLLSDYGHNVRLTDLDDWRDGRARAVRFEKADVCDRLPFSNDSFDLVYSYNAFEHFPAPAPAFAEMLRVCKPDALIYLEFGPLYTSPWGLHADRLLMPYPQFLFTTETIAERLEQLGIYDLGKERSDLQYVNEWRVSAFRALWRRAGCTIVDERHYVDDDYLDVILRFPACFQGRGLTYDDVTIGGLFVTLRKSMVPAAVDVHVS
jgi:SAM-dependent methyltransferase